jgi:hypothetical protein
MAVPHAAGVAAVYLGSNPGASPAEVRLRAACIVVSMTSMGMRMMPGREWGG